jgi:hypothetical protein
MNNWTFFWCSLASPDFTVAGISFELEVFKLFKDTKEIVDVKLPIQDTPYKCRVYAIFVFNRMLKVAYGECTPGVYVAYADEITLPFCTPQFNWSKDQKKWVKVEERERDCR